MRKKILVLADTKKLDVCDCLDKVRPWLEERVEIQGWYKNIQEIQGEKQKLSGADYLLVFGGDGLFLAAAREVADQKIPLIGVNFGKLGFLTELDIEDFFDRMPEILQGKGIVSSRMMIECEVRRAGEKVYSHLAVNDVAIKAASAFRMLYLALYINEEEIATYGGDGVIIATPVGSTAYSLSAGGPVVCPNLSALVITPICAHLLTLRPLVISSQNILRIALLPPFGDEIMLTIDGQVNYNLTKEDEIFISTANQSFYMLETGEKSFFQTLRAKLTWGEGRLKMVK